VRGWIESRIVVLGMAAGLFVTRHQLRELITRQEAERHHVADELHEQAAQTLAGVLLGLRALEREFESDLAAPKLGTLRSNVDSTLRTLRSLAVSLRPQVLQLGLQAALEAPAAEARDRGFNRDDRRPRRH
jgi:signal transduction histidine kinase